MSEKCTAGGSAAVVVVPFILMMEDQVINEEKTSHTRPPDHDGDICTLLLVNMYFGYGPSFGPRN